MTKQWRLGYAEKAFMGEEIIQEHCEYCQNCCYHKLLKVKAAGSVIFFRYEEFDFLEPRE